MEQHSCSKNLEGQEPEEQAHFSTENQLPDDFCPETEESAAHTLSRMPLKGEGLAWQEHLPRAILVLLDQTLLKQVRKPLGKRAEIH